MEPERARWRRWGGAAWRWGVIGMMALATVRWAGPAPSAGNVTHDVNQGTSVTTSRNWSGYVATGGAFTTVQGTWAVPKVTGPRHTLEATWVGIGGATSGDRTLIQAGTQNMVSVTGQVRTSAWIEMLPAVSQPVSMTVHPGDRFTVTIKETGTNQWNLALSDVSTGQNISFNESYTSQHASAEWVEEAPTRSGHIARLANFGTISFSGGSTTKNGESTSIGAAHGQSITMVNRVGQPIAVPSALGSDGESFSISFQ